MQTFTADQFGRTVAVTVPDDERELNVGLYPVYEDSIGNGRGLLIAAFLVHDEAVLYAKNRAARLAGDKPWEE